MDPRGILKAFPKRQKIHADASSKVLAKIPRREEGEEAEEWLSSLRAHVVRTGIGRARAELFEKQIVQHGGQLCPAQGPGVTHIVVDEGMDYERALRLLRLPQLPPGAQLVKSAWLSLCLQERRLVDVAGFSIFIPSRYLDHPQPSKAEQDASIPPGTHEALLQTALSPPPPPTRPVSPPQKAKEAPNTQAQPISDDEASDGEETQVQKAAQAFNSGLLCVACGSYRRGKATCGDVDVLITHPDGRSHRGIFSRLLDSLRQEAVPSVGPGFLTDDLVSQEENGQQQKYLGVCRLPGPGRRHRRLDIIVVPYSEFACALLYFTGSAHFNRSMRALAKTKGMSLSEHALSTAVVRNTHGCKVGPGRVLPTPTEKDVFRLLGLPYREPAERDW
eukprot:XP_016871576.1 DNA polymerase lambda isoform X11 [Homo sapiens]